MPCELECCVILFDAMLTSNNAFNAMLLVEQPATHMQAEHQLEKALRDGLYVQASLVWMQHMFAHHACERAAKNKIAW